MTHYSYQLKEEVMDDNNNSSRLEGGGCSSRKGFFMCNLFRLVIFICRTPQGDGAWDKRLLALVPIPWSRKQTNRSGLVTNLISIICLLYLCCGALHLDKLEFWRRQRDFNSLVSSYFLRNIYSTNSTQNSTASKYMRHLKIVWIRGKKHSALPLRLRLPF